MYARQHASRIKEEFWTAFGRYMNPVPSAEGEKINWINYHTKVKDVFFRMDAGNKSALIAITIEHRDLGIQELFFQQFLELRLALHGMLEEEWIWQRHVASDDGRIISRIYKELPGVSVFNKDQWPELISFFKPRIIALDSFWEHARWSFEELK